MTSCKAHKEGELQNLQLLCHTIRQTSATRSLLPTYASAIRSRTCQPTAKMFKRLVICVLNFLFPPLAVLMLTGLNQDVILNCVLFLLAVIPSHIHGFYISFTYFNRKRKVRKGVYPGSPTHLIWSDKVNNGGASRREIQQLLDEKEGKSLTTSLSRKLTNKIDSWNDGNSEKFVEAGNRLSRKSTRRSRPNDDEYDNDNSPQSSRSSRRIIF